MFRKQSRPALADLNALLWLNWNLLAFLARGIPDKSKKSHGRREPTKNSAYIWHHADIEPGLHQWEGSVLITAPSDKSLVCVFKQLTKSPSICSAWRVQLDPWKHVNNVICKWKTTDFAARRTEDATISSCTVTGLVFELEPEHWSILLLCFEDW